MTEERYKLPTLASVYVGLVLVASIYFLAVAEENPMGGLFALLLTIPWSIALVQLLTAVLPKIFETLWAGPVIVLLSAVINVIIIVVVSKRFRSKPARK